MNLHFASRSFSVAAVLVASLFALPAIASDHDDTQLLKDTGRHDARITDFYAFVRDGRLVTAVTMNPTIPVGVSSYVFPDDLVVRVFIENNAKVSFDDPVAVALYGGSMAKSEKIKEDVVFEVRFAGGSPSLATKGLPAWGRAATRLFAGLRDDPFIRGPRIGRNVSAVVIDVPIEAVVRGRASLVLWAGTEVTGVTGPIADLGGRALRSQFLENLALNDFHPREHESVLGLPPDVIFVNLRRPIAFPNGRELADDVVDIVADPRILANDMPFPDANDVPFLSEFPYLALPQLP